MHRYCLPVLFAVVIITSLPSQTYKKKVVSFVDNVLLPARVVLSAEQTGYIRNAVTKTISYERFNYVPLPPAVVASFSRGTASLTRFTPENIKPVLDSTLAPQLLQLLDINKELLSRQNLTETERNTFLATKAKAAGLSAQELTAILNSGYFYIPYVAMYSHTAKKDVREEKDEHGKVTKKVPFTTFKHELQLGVLWYKLLVDDANKGSVVFIGSAKGWKGGSISRSEEKDDDKSGNADWDAFKSAVDASCNNIGLETKRMEEFTLTGGVTETSASGLRLSLGTREGLGLDDTYWIEEMEETESGQIIKTRRGFVKIRVVGDNQKSDGATSYAQIITGTNYSAGLSATELPLLGMNALIAFGAFPARVSSFNAGLPNPPQFVLDNAKYNFGVRVDAESKMAYGGKFAFQASLARVTKISELWFHLGLDAGLTTIDGMFFLPVSGGGTDSVSIGASWTGSINAGLLKKFYFRRYGFILQADVKYSLLRMSAGGKDPGDGADISYKLTNGALGFDARAGLETYLSPSLSIGVAAEYNFFGSSNVYTALVTDKNNSDITKKTDMTGPDLTYGGLGYYAWLNFSIPSFF